MLLALAYTFYGLELLPLVWLAALWSGGHRLPASWWWLAVALAVSFVADTVALMLAPLDRWTVSAFYPITQAGLVSYVLLPTPRARRFIAALVVVGILAALAPSRTLPTRTVAWLGVAGLAWRTPLPPRLRLALGWLFGLGWVSWLGVEIWPGILPSWLTYKIVWTVGLGVFCWAALRPMPAATELERKAG